MKIVFFIGSLQRGGAERVTSILANHYVALGHDVEICLLLNNIIGYNLDKSIKINDFSLNKGSYLTKAPKWSRKIRKYIKESKPDRVISFVGRINVLVLFACRHLNVPVIVSERNDPKCDGRSKSMLWLCNKMYKKAHAVVFQTNYQKECFSKSLGKISYLIENPVSVSATRVKNEPFLVVTAGRLSEQKNQKMLIDAVSKLSHNYPEIKLCIFGNGPLKENLEKQISELNMQNRIFLNGNISDLHEKIANANVFVMTSNFEGMPNALLEALMLGIPCITTNFSGAKEIIQNNQNGVVIERNNVFQLCEALKRVFDEPGLKEKLSKNALSSSERFKEEIVLKKWDETILI